ncbi:hypothetical protein [Thermus caldilimi]|uniref:hypothetical protein n=1 Tax=Thermus caldilimi TaxID=2483360 RepID=UPI0010766430|nr:hypothetical protein [Thermus caldilimi]
MGKGTKAAHPQAEGVVGIPEAFWQELFGEVDHLRVLYERFKGAGEEERKVLEEEILHSLTHLWAHAKVMWEEISLSEEGGA